MATGVRELGPGRRSALRTPLFRQLWLANVISNAGSWMQIVAAGWLIFELTGSAAWVGALALAQRLPMVALVVVGGVLADRVERRRVVLGCAIGQALCAAALALVVAQDAGGALAVLLLVGAGGIGFGLQGPALHSLVPTLVERDLLPSAARLNSIGINLARIIGPAVAGLLLAGVGPAACFAVNAATFAAVILNAVRLPQARPEPGAGKGGLRAGLGYVRSEPAVRRLLVGMAAFTVFASPLQTLAPAIAGHVTSDPAALGWMLTAFGAGALAGAWVLGRAERRWERGRLIAAASVGFAAALACVGLAESLPLLLAATALGGAFWLWTFASTQTALQLGVRDDMRGRVMGLYLLAIVGPMPLSATVTGLIGDAVGLGPVLLGCAGCLLVWGFVSLQRPAPRPLRQATAEL